MATAAICKWITRIKTPLRKPCQKNALLDANKSTSGPLDFLQQIQRLLRVFGE
jgi:hypothetical protein